MATAAQSKQEGFAAFIKELVVLVLIVFLIRTFGFGLYQVPTGSMENKILVGERFFADKFSYIFTDPKANDIILIAGKGHETYQEVNGVRANFDD